jgi:phage terminase large subunit-like protein
VKHEKGKSHIFFKSYGKGREKWQGETVDLIWFDEEPDMSIYSEGMTRTSKVLGPIITTFTPLKGMSEVVYRFHGEDHPERKIIQMSIWDIVEEENGHYSKEEAAKIIDGYPDHEREARSTGTPMLGSGRIFPVSEESIKIESDYQIPKYWPQIIGMDFGWGITRRQQ